MSVQISVEQHEGTSQGVSSICSETEEAEVRNKRTAATTTFARADTSPTDLFKLIITQLQSRQMLCGILLPGDHRYRRHDSDLQTWVSAGCSGRSVWRNAPGPSLSPAFLPSVERPLRSSCHTHTHTRGSHKFTRWSGSCRQNQLCLNGT